MDAGRLDQRVTLQTASLGRDAVGGPVETWADTATVWAAVRPLSGRQIARAQQVGSQVSKAVTIRWRSGVSDKQRIRFSDGSTAKVSWIEEYRREGRIVIVCEDLNG